MNRAARPKKSSSWNYFELTCANEVRCKLCEKTLVYHGSTSSMRSHLSAKHAKEVPTDTDAAQPAITNFISRPRRCDSRRAGDITALITNMIVKDMLPISFVEGGGFLELMASVEPDYRVPGRTTMTKRIEKLYKDKAEDLRRSLSTVSKVSITTDGWTALTTESYVTITCHYIDSEWEMKSAVLQTRATPERHTAEHLAEGLRSATESWGILEKVTACVHDNASNVTLANNEYLDWDSSPCYAHTLQLAINDGFKLKPIHHIVAGASRLVSHFHHSTVATQALCQKQVDQTLPDHRLIQYCRTRWNFIYDMFDRLLEQRWAVAAVLSDRSVTTLSDARTLDLADDSWIVMEEMLPVLGSLKCATTALCGESGVSSSLIYPVTATLLTKHLPVAPEESKKVAEYKQTVSVSLKRRLKPDEVESAKKVPFIASFLDPRHKHLKFANDALRDAVKARVKELLSALAVGADAKPEITEEDYSESESTGGSAAGGSAAAKRPRYDNKSAMLTLFGEEYHAETPVTPEMELSHYCDEKCIAPHLDPLDWWRVNETKYERLAQLARSYLCVPATSVPSERVFSAAGLILNRLRSRLHPDHVDQLIFLNKN